ncbi:Hypothetical protein PHPALM_3091 [Phytophthora palmivora]|uniref:Uncharacterized protein n=1 Tax=Phytophthora palmivora TaxID=4796 RepID=A0A2P4YNC9_9STRA|nr:Hypothetical protein PHPALM_3091 [Phytophthora palmivora]
MAVAAHRQQSFKTVGVHCPSSHTVILTAATQTTTIRSDQTIETFATGEVKPQRIISQSKLFESIISHFDQLSLLLDTIKHGVKHQFRPLEATGHENALANHKSARLLDNALRRSIREGQDAGPYLVVDIDMASTWNDVHISPFGCVPKRDANPAVEARVIHDLSYPTRRSVNSAYDPATLPPLCKYGHVHRISRRIEELKDSRPTCTVKFKRGDAMQLSEMSMQHGSLWSICGCFAGRRSSGD